MSRKASGVIRNIYPHTSLFGGSQYMLERAEKGEDECFYDVLASILFTAFCIEAFLNLLGSSLSDEGNDQPANWQEQERKLSPKEKLKLISAAIDYKVDLSKKPFQTFVELFNLRDNVVHAKVEKLS